MIGHEQRIYPTTTFVVRCTALNCPFTCSHPTLKAATSCYEDHCGTHHGGPR